LGKFQNLASRRPVTFAILATLGALISVTLAATIAVIAFGVDQTSPALGLIGNVVATMLVILLLWRFGWLKAAGVASWGSWVGWIAAIGLLLYYLLELSYSFFGNMSFSVPVLAAGLPRLPGVFVAGLFEEILFRGLVLHALVRVWGTTRTGMLRAAFVSAVFFGFVHLLNAIQGDPGAIPGQIAIALVEGIWWAAIVLRWGSVWPAVLLHVAANWVMQTKAMGLADFQEGPTSYALAAVLGLPLAVVGVWWILRTDPPGRVEQG
jgi:membrane protease YdiL (CAAX protease family)